MVSLLTVILNVFHVISGHFYYLFVLFILVNCVFYSSKYFVHCPVCDYGSEVKKDALENLINGPAIEATEQPEASTGAADTEFTNNTTDGF